MQVKDFHQCCKRGAVGAIAAASLMTTGYAFAGGSDLDSLRAQATVLQERLAALEAQEAQREYTYVKSGNDKYKVSLSGHVNRAVVLAHSKHEEELFHTDNDLSSSRFRIEGEAKYNDDVTLGTVIELQVESNSTFDADFDQDKNAASISDRKVEFFVNSEKYGKVSVGKGNTASFLTGSFDLSQADLVVGHFTAGFAAGLTFHNTSGAPDGVKVFPSFDTFDGAGRTDRLRYDTPNFAGLQFAASSTDNGNWDVATTYAREINGFKVAGGVGFADMNAGLNDNQRVSASVSVLHDSGINLTLAGGRDHGNRIVDGAVVDKSQTMMSRYAKLGYIFNPTSLGHTAVAVDYHRTDDVEADGDQADSWGLGLVQCIDKIATEAYLGYRNFDLDRKGVNFEDINVGMVGARVKF